MKNIFWKNLQTFLTLQSKWGPEEELCLSSLFIYILNFKITITNLSSKFYIYYLKSGYFLKIECPPSSRKEVQLYALPPHTICEWRTEINKVDLVYRITRPFIKHNLDSSLECEGHKSFISCQNALQNDNHNILQTCKS